MKIKLCDQNGILFTDTDIPDDKHFNKFIKRENGFCFAEFDDDKIEIVENDTFSTIHYYIKDQKGTIKVHEIINGVIV